MTPANAARSSNGVFTERNPTVRAATAPSSPALPAAEASVEAARRLARNHPSRSRRPVMPRATQNAHPGVSLDGPSGAHSIDEAAFAKTRSNALQHIDEPQDIGPRSHYRMRSWPARPPLGERRSAAIAIPPPDNSAIRPAEPPPARPLQSRRRHVWHRPRQCSNPWRGGGIRGDAAGGSYARHNSGLLRLSIVVAIARHLADWALL